jgi:hypothetical protein
LQEYHSKAFNFSSLQEYHSKGLRGCLFWGAIFAEHADSTGVASLYGVGSSDERLHACIISAKNIIPKELPFGWAQECPIIAQEYHSIGLSIAMRSRIVGDEIGPGGSDYDTRTARF